MRAAASGSAFIRVDPRLKRFRRRLDVGPDLLRDEVVHRDRGVPEGESRFAVNAPDDHALVRYGKREVEPDAQRAEQNPAVPHDASKRASADAYKRIKS